MGSPFLRGSCQSWREGGHATDNTPWREDGERGGSRLRGGLGGGGRAGGGDRFACARALKQGWKKSGSLKY